MGQELNNMNDSSCCDTNTINKTILNKQYNDLFANTVMWKSKWKDLKKFINPNLGSFDEDMTNQGSRDDEELINWAGFDANRIQSAGMQSGINSPSRPWFKLKLANEQLGEIDSVKNYLATYESTMYNVLAKSNFYNSAHSFYEELGCFGSAVMLIFEDLNNVVQFNTLTCGEYAIGLGANLKVNRLARLLRLTVSQIIEQFGIDNVRPQIKSAYQNKNYNVFYRVKHMIFPNPKCDPAKKSNKTMAYSDYYWMDEGEETKFLKESGFTSCPVCFAPWATTGSDIYGKSPGWASLGDSKSLQLLETDTYIASEMQIKPPMIAPLSSLQTGGVNINPGGISPYTPNGNGDSSIRPAFQVNFNFQEIELKIKKLEDSIHRKFFADLFLMLENIEHTGMTATEIQERSQEKMTMIGNILERLQNDFLRPMIERVSDLMHRVPNLLPPPPQELQGQNIEIEYVSILAQAQRMTSITAIQQTAQFAIGLAQANPAILDNIDFDAVIDEYASSLGVPPSMILGKDKVFALRQQRQQEQAQQQKMAQMQQAMQVAQQGSQVAQNLSGLPIGSENNDALNALFGIPGGAG